MQCLLVSVMLASVNQNRTTHSGELTSVIMAGSLNMKFIPSCTEHGTPCYIKTGTRDGPNKGKSFFICGNQKGQCSFAQPAKGIQASSCPEHQQMVELHAIARKSNELRFHYRCIEGKKQHVGWCGYEKLPLEASIGQTLTDITNKVKEKLSRKQNQNNHSLKDLMEQLPSKPSVPGNERENFQRAQTEKENADERETFLNCAVSVHATTQDKDSTKIMPSQNQQQNIIVLESSDEEDHRANNCINDVSEECLQQYDNFDSSCESTATKQCNAVQRHNGTINFGKNRNLIEKELEAKKKTLQNINVQHLPDGGKRMLDQIQNLKEMLAQAKSGTHLWNAQQDIVPLEDECHEQHPSLEDRRKLDFSYPHNQLGITSGAHFIQQQRLYDGRMTKNKLQQVGKITRDAIEVLHRSLETCPTSTTECADPFGLNVTLMPHQRQALAWLLWREKQCPSGGILADDMGLGKTLTSISLIMKDKQNGFEKKSIIATNMKNSAATLIVCPASLIHQWRKEIETRVKPLNLTISLYHGTTREKNLERLSRYDVVLTTYSIVSREMKELITSKQDEKKSKNMWLTTEGALVSQAKKKTISDTLLSQIHWRRVILDEAHTIKNHSCATSIATCFIEAESRWALTGTPIQNNTMDLFAIIKFLRCSPFDELKVWKKWVDDKSARGAERMSTLVKSLLLRRTKNQTDSIGRPLVSLPTRQSTVHKVTLHGNEKEVYDLLHFYSKNMLHKFLQDRGSSTSIHQVNPARSVDSQENSKKYVMGKNVDELLDMFGLSNRQVNAGAILLMVLRLRQCCNHLSLLRELLDEDEKKEEGIELPIEEQLMNMSITESSPINTEWRPAEFRASFISTKVEGLLTELHKLHQSSDSKNMVKSVIVSQWTKMLDIVAYHLGKNGFKFDFITGSVPVKKRSEIVEDFNVRPNGIQIMLVSLRAGGVGLNLIGGSHLFLLDQHWNPALEDQACDRIYRVGQKNDVFIHRFLCTETIEEKIVALQDKKKSVADTVLKGGRQTNQKLTLQDLKLLFGV